MHRAEKLIQQQGWQAVEHALQPERDWCGQHHTVPQPWGEGTAPGRWQGLRVMGCGLELEWR